MKKKFKEISPRDKKISSTFLIGYDKEKKSMKPRKKNFKRPFWKKKF